MRRQVCGAMRRKGANKAYEPNVDDASIPRTNPWDMPDANIPPGFRKAAGGNLFVVIVG